MTEMILLDPVRVLVGPDQPLQDHGAALLRGGRLEALGEPAREAARSAGLSMSGRLLRLVMSAGCQFAMLQWST